MENLIFTLIGLIVFLSILVAQSLIKQVTSWLFGLQPTTLSNEAVELLQEFKDDPDYLNTLSIICEFIKDNRRQHLYDVDLEIISVTTGLPRTQLAQVVALVQVDTVYHKRNQPDQLVSVDTFTCWLLKRDQENLRNTSVRYLLNPIIVR